MFINHWLSRTLPVGRALPVGRVLPGELRRNDLRSAMFDFQWVAGSFQKSRKKTLSTIYFSRLNRTEIKRTPTQTILYIGQLISNSCVNVFFFKCFFPVNINSSCLRTVCLSAVGCQTKICHALQCLSTIGRGRLRAFLCITMFTKELITTHQQIYRACIRSVRS